MPRQNVKHMLEIDKSMVLNWIWWKSTHYPTDLCRTHNRCKCTLKNSLSTVKTCGTNWEEYVPLDWRKEHLQLYIFAEKIEWNIKWYLHIFTVWLYICTNVFQTKLSVSEKYPLSENWFSIQEEIWFREHGRESKCTNCQAYKYDSARNETTQSSYLRSTTNTHTHT